MSGITEMIHHDTSNVQKVGNVTIYPDMLQGSDEWFAVRCGVLTASQMKLAVKKKTDKKTGEVTYPIVDDNKTKIHVQEIAAQKISEHVEPSYQGDAMLRGHEEEIYAKVLYNEHEAKGYDVGFMTNDKWGFTLGCSPDGLIGADGMIECKSRIQKYQVKTIATNEMPDEYSIQVQTGLLVSERKWTDFISYSNGLPMFTLRIYPDHEVHKAIIAAAKVFYKNVSELMKDYKKHLAKPGARLIPTERREPNEGEIII